MKSYHFSYYICIKPPVKNNDSKKHIESANEFINIAFKSNDNRGYIWHNYGSDDCEVYEGNYYLDVPLLNFEVNNIYKVVDGMILDERGNPHYFESLKTFFKEFKFELDVNITNLINIKKEKGYHVNIIPQRYSDNSLEVLIWVSDKRNYISKQTTIDNLFHDMVDIFRTLARETDFYRKLKRIILHE